MWSFDFFSTGEVIFLAQHWIFAGQYLKIALTIQLTFSVKTEEIYEHNDSLYLFLEYLDGGSMEKIVQNYYSSYSEEFVKYSIL